MVSISSSPFKVRVLIILSGSKSFILRSSHAFEELHVFLKYLFPMEWREARITIAVSPENMDLFNIIRLKNYSKYELALLTSENLGNLISETYDLILSTLEQSSVHKTVMKLLDKMGNNGSIYLGNRFFSFSSIDIKIPLIVEIDTKHEYFLCKPPHPIDIVHTTMPHKKVDEKDTRIIGINIGEDDEPSLRPPISVISDLIQEFYNDPNNKIVLFGSENLKVRLQMINYKLKTVLKGNASIISATNLDLHSELLAQAIPMCDLFISFEGFMVDIAVAFKVKTICLSPRSDFICFDSEYLRVFRSSWDYKKCNRICFSENRCPFIDDAEEESETCFYGFNTKEISLRAMEFLNGI